MSKSLEGILEIHIKQALFPDKKNSFKTYFEFLLGPKVYRTKISSGQLPEWKDKITAQYTSETLLFIKFIEKNTFSKDKVLLEQQLELNLLKSQCRQEEQLKVILKGKERGSFKIQLILFPYRLSPSNLCNEIIEEKFICSFSYGNEDFYTGLFNPGAAPANIFMISFPNGTSMQACKLKWTKYRSMIDPGLCKVLGLFDKITENTAFLLVVLEKPTEIMLYEEIQNRRLTGNPWEEKELMNILKALVRAMRVFEDLEIFHGDISPLNLQVTGRVCFLSYGVGYRPLESFFIDKLSLMPELKFPYISPNQLTNYELSLNKQGPKPQNMIKSDVFSLGLVMLHMAALEAPLGLNDIQNALESRIYNKVNSLNYSQSFKGILLQMLNISELKRGSFSKIYMLLNK